MKQNFYARFAAFGIFGAFLLLVSMSTVLDVGAQGITNTPPASPSITPSFTPTPSPTPTATLTIEERLTHLEEVITLPKKDGWDIAKIITDIVIAGFISGGLAWFSIWATKSFNQRQLEAENIRAEAQLQSEEIRARNQLTSEEQRAKEQKQIQEAQTVQQFMPLLQSEDQRTVEAALLTITSLGNEKLAARLAELFRNEGSLAALNKMAASGNAKISEAAENSLNEIYKQHIQKIVQISRGGKTLGTGIFVDNTGYILTTHNIISGNGEISVILNSGSVPARIVKFDENSNLALLKVDGQEFTSMPLDMHPVVPQMLDEIILIGQDARVGITVTVGAFAGIANVPEYPDCELLGVKVVAPRSYGGAVAFDKTGQLLGMVVLMWLDESKSANTVYVLPTMWLDKYVHDSISV